MYITIIYMPLQDQVQDTNQDQQQNTSTTKPKVQQQQSKSKLGTLQRSQSSSSQMSSDPLPDSHSPHRAKQRPHKAKHQPHKAKHQPIQRVGKDSNPQVFDVLAINENLGYEALKNLLIKHADDIGQEIVGGLLQSAGNALDYLTGAAVISAQAKWADNIRPYMQKYDKFQESLNKMGETMGQYETKLKPLMQMQETLNSPGLHIVRVFFKYILGRGTAFVLSLGGTASKETIHTVSSMADGISSLKKQFKVLQQAVNNKMAALGISLDYIKSVASSSSELLGMLENFSISKALAWGWQRGGTGQTFTEFVMKNNSNVGKFGSASILISALGFIAAAASLKQGRVDLAGKLALGSVGLGATGMAAKYYDHKYMGKEKPKPQPPQLDQQQKSLSSNQPELEPDNGRFFWLNLQQADINTWDTDQTIENEQSYISQWVYGKQQEQKFRAGGAEVKFGMGFNLFGKKLLKSNSHVVRLDWGGNFEYRNSDIQLIDGLDFGEAFKMGSVNLTNIVFNNGGLQSMGLKIQNIKVAGESLVVDEVSGEWSKQDGFTFNAEANAHLLGHDFNGSVNFGLDNQGKLIAGKITVGSNDEFEVLKDVLTISNFMLTGGIDEEKNVSIGAASDLDIMKNNPHFTAKVGKAYVKYDQSQQNNWVAGINTFDAQIMGGRIGVFFQGAKIEGGELTINRATLTYTKGGNSDDQDDLENNNLFGDLENIFSIIKTLQVSATVGGVSLSKAKGFKFTEAPSWALNKLEMEYAGFKLALAITEDGLKGKLAGSFDKQINIFKVLVEVPIPAVPGVNLIGKAALDAHLGANATLDVEMNNKDARNKNNKGDKYLKITGGAGFNAGVGLTAGLGASIGVANVASVSGMLMGRFGVEMKGQLDAGATLVFNRNSPDGIVRQGERPEDKFKMRASADVNPTFDISGGLFFNLLGHEFSLAQYTLAKWELGGAHFAFEAAPDEKGRYHITPDQDNISLNGKKFLKDGDDGFSKAAKGIPAEREKYVKLRETFDQAEEALGKKSDNVDELVTQLTQEGQGAETQMLDTLSMMTAKHAALLKRGGKQELKEAASLQKEIETLKRDTKKVLLVNHNPRAAVEYLHYYRTQKSFKAGFNRMLRKHFAIWDWRLLNRYAKIALANEGTERVFNPGIFGSKQDKQAHSEYNTKLRAKELELGQNFDVDSKLASHVPQEHDEEDFSGNDIEQELADEVRSHVKQIQDTINENDPRGKRSPDGSSTV